MPKEEWGVKRLCPTTGQRFYDLNKNPIVSPYTGEVVTIDESKNRTMVADKADPASKKAEEKAEDEVEVVDDDDTADVELDDSLLDDDDDAEEVSLDEIADVPADDDDT